MSASPPPPHASPVDANRPAEVIVIRQRRRLGRSAVRRFFELPGWKRALLILAIVLAVAGIAGSVTGMFRETPPEAKVAQVRVEQLHAVGPRSSLTADQQTELKQAETKVDAARHWFYDKTAPQLWRIGLGFFIAFVLGFMARQFLKTMATLAALLVVIVGVAVYLGAFDAGGVKANLATGTGWIMDRLDSMKESLLKFVGTSLSGTAGFVIGFMRSRR